MNNLSQAAVEVLEIYKYLDTSLKKLITEKDLEYLNSIKDKNYIFEINKNIPLYDNDFKEETIILLINLLNKKEK